VYNISRDSVSSRHKCNDSPKKPFLFLAGFFLKEKAPYNKIFHFQKTV
jgi:hypothetical protein